MHHLFAPFGGLASEVVGKALGIDESLAEEWAGLGAIYCERARIPFDLRVEKGDYLRVHSFPQRYPTAAVDWAARVVYDAGDFVIVDKPHGIPVHPTVDNGKEHCLAGFASVLGSSLYAPQRLDVAADGLLALSRTAHAQARFQRWQAEGRVGKIYSTFVDSRVPPGRHSHFMQPSRRAPRVMSATFREGWDACELIMEACEEAKTPLLPPVFRPRIRLLTGRTHQIRAQLAALGAPILGDFLYGSLHGREHFRLRSVRLSLPRIGEWEISEPFLAPFA